IYGDIVGTKTFNKTFGESYGNIMIAKVSDLLAGISSKNIVFRYTGDSFIIIVIDSAHLEEYKEKVIEALKRSINIESMNIVVQMKMFCINDMKMETSSESLSRTIELSSRMLKNSHPNKIVTLSKEVIRESQRSSEIEGALRRALASNNIEIFLQPVIDITTGRVAAAEALARINDPEMGLIRPADFIPIAEETGMISSLSLKVVNRVCMFLKSTPLECYRNLKWVSINLSVSDCLSRAQGEKICNIIESYGIAPHKIAFEITETMATIEKILPENLRILTDKGFSLALDDFGTEYANIDSALRLPFSLAKLDRSVIHIVHNRNQMKILKRMVGVFNELGLETVAEGVDSQEMIDIAASAGVRYMQGFFYSKPLPVNVFINYLIQNKERNNQ
ncbi:MAG: GGDEF domain-containing phosphodiesterase, partial [Sphaerochaetaceae bacterium]|nr:GGDEF domain-containing phosphodiesterase [Sphaerochaetaceae bacterium]